MAKPDQRFLSLIRDSWDLHVHAAPSLWPRRGDALELAQVCRDAGMAGMVLKAHHGSTVEAAYLANRAVPGIKVLGGLVLNHFVGGINPLAVEASLRLGASIIWMPTVHAASHGHAVGPLGGFEFQDHGLDPDRPLRGIRLGEGDADDDAAREVLALVADSDAALATGHLSGPEVLWLQQQAKQDRRSIRLLVNHVFFHSPRLDSAQIAALTGPNTFFEVCFLSMTSQVSASTASQVAAALTAHPSAQWILASDSGQASQPPTPDALAMACQWLLEAGVPLDTLETMLRKHPAQLLGAHATTS